MPYTVRAPHLHGHHARTLEEPTPEAAAVAYAEDFAHGPDDEDVLTLIVRDVETGREQCFRVDTETGETAPCG
jgi:hypothetical protein